MIFELERWDRGWMLVNPDFAEILEFNGIHRAEDLWAMDGEPVKKQLVERGTERGVLRKPCGGEELVTYIMRCTPIPLKKRFKDLFSLKFVSRNEAYHEWEAILEFHAHGLPTMLLVATAKAGSCNLTLGITDYTRASELARQLAEQGAAARDRRRDLIQKVAKLARGVHDAGMAHQDFYLVHIFIKEAEHDRLFLNRPPAHHHARPAAAALADQGPRPAALLLRRLPQQVRPHVFLEILRRPQDVQGQAFHRGRHRQGRTNQAPFRQKPQLRATP